MEFQSNQYNVRLMFSLIDFKHRDIRYWTREFLLLVLSLSKYQINLKVNQKRRCTSSRSDIFHEIFNGPHCYSQSNSNECDFKKHPTLSLLNCLDCYVCRNE